MEYFRQLSEQGYAFIPGQYYIFLNDAKFEHEEDFHNDLMILRNGFDSLMLDPYSPGQRWRGYAQCRRNDDKEFVFGHFTPYQQTKKYNQDTGGIIREYPLLSDEITKNRIVQTILNDDIKLVESYGKIGSLEDLTVGIHLFRYKAEVGAPAYSSPVWLHKDDEDVVFVHLINASENMLGGDNIIATGPRDIEQVIRLENIFDTLVVNHDKYHAVTPVGARDGTGVARRDIILITFQRNVNIVGNAA